MTMKMASHIAPRNRKIRFKSQQKDLHLRLTLEAKNLGEKVENLVGKEEENFDKVNNANIDCKII